MGYIGGIFDIGLKALKTQQLAMEVASHNIANVNTPGYSRQIAVTETTDPASIGTVGQRGTGVKVSDIKRVFDSFSTAQRNTQVQSYGDASAKGSVLQSVELVFNETSGGGLRSALSDFFNAWESLANHPDSEAEREAVIQKGNSLVMSFKNIAQYLNGVKEDTDRSLASTVSEINTLTGQIVSLNSEIQGVEGRGENANDLNDKRDYLVRQLSEKIGVNTLKMDNGMVSIFLPTGQSLVESLTQGTLSADISNNQTVINLVDQNGNKRDITNRIQNGNLGGYISGRDSYLQSYLDDVNELAARVVVEVNKLHYNGYGLDGSTNNLFFQQPTLSTGANSANTGGATINSGTISDPSVLTADDYEIRFTGSNTYDIVATTTSTTVVSGASYTSGADIVFRGITVAITDGGSGPANGDVFTVGLNKSNMAASIGIDSAVSASLNKIAAAQQDPLTVSGVGDNRNALLIADLINTDTMNKGGATFNEFYSTLVSDVGSDVHQVENEQEFYDFSLQQLSNLRESISGVSIDEETINLTKFQNAYAAGAKLLGMATELMDILMKLGQ